MLNRWAKFQNSGFGGKIKNEREIFETLFLDYGKSFFENCGQVVAFLEENGTGKKGEEGKIYSPMVWIRDHWETNLARFEDWKGRKKALDEAHAVRIEKEAKAKAEAAEKERLRREQEEEEERWQQELTAATDRFLALYHSEEEINAFVEEAIQLDGNSFVSKAWHEHGWDSSLVRSCTLTHFRKVESGQRRTQVQPKSSEEIA